MHRIFSVQEIVYYIFLNFAPWLSDHDVEELPGLYFAQKSTLANLARSCSSFTEVSNDLLWRDMASLDPLLLLLPSDTVALRKQAWKFLRPIGEDDWTRFNRYARRVHHLYIVIPSGDPSGTASGFSNEFFQNMQSSFAASHSEPILLPRLRRFYCTQHRMDTEHWPLLMTRTLETLSISLSHSIVNVPATFGLFIASTIQRASLLSLHTLHLNLASHAISPSILEAYKKMFKSVPSLRTFYGPRHISHNSELAKVIMEIPHLRHFDDGYTRKPYWHLTGANQHSWRVGLSGLHTFLRSTEPRNVVKISTQSGELSSLHLYGEVVSLLAQKCSQLEYLKISAVHEGDDDDLEDLPPLETPISVISMMDSFHDLTSLHINIKGEAARAMFIPRDEATFLTLCMSWPLLRSFKLRLEGDEDNWGWDEESRWTHPNITVQAILEPLAAHCRHLYKVALWIHMVMDAERPEAACQFSSCLSELNLADSAIKIDEEVVYRGDWDAYPDLWTYLLELVGGDEEKLRGVGEL